MRNLEESLFWEVFYRHDVVRSELARLFNVSAATISRSVSVFLTKQLVVKRERQISCADAGLPYLQINPQLAYVAGIEFDRDRITVVMTDMGANLLGRGAVAASSRNPVAKTLRRLPHSGSNRAGGRGSAQWSNGRIGAGHTGTLDVENGLCLDWEGAAHWRGVNCGRRCARPSTNK